MTVYQLQELFGVKWDKATVIYSEANRAGKDSVEGYFKYQYFRYYTRIVENPLTHIPVEDTWDRLELGILQIKVQAPYNLAILPVASSLLSEFLRKLLLGPANSAEGLYSAGRPVCSPHYFCQYKDTSYHTHRSTGQLGPTTLLLICLFSMSHMCGTTRELFC
jgi:hypothetical protein